MLSPNPGVSTIVSAMRTPSSSSSATANKHFPVWTVSNETARTDIDWLDLDALLQVRVLRVVRYLVVQHLRLAERIHERRATRPGRACLQSYHAKKANIDCQHCPPAPLNEAKKKGNAPTTMTVNCTPFFTFPLRLAAYDMVVVCAGQRELAAEKIGCCSMRCATTRCPGGAVCFRPFGSRARGIAFFALAPSLIFNLNKMLQLQYGGLAAEHPASAYIQNYAILELGLFSSCRFKCIETENVSAACAR